jgi:hypothetical protein
MAREKIKRNKREPKKLIGAMSVRRVALAEPKYLICVKWTSDSDFIIKTRLNPNYRQH